MVRQVLPDSDFLFVLELQADVVMPFVHSCPREYMCTILPVSVLAGHDGGGRGGVFLDALCSEPDSLSGRLAGPSDVREGEA